MDENVWASQVKFHFLCEQINFLCIIGSFGGGTFLQCRLSFTRFDPGLGPVPASELDHGSLRDILAPGQQKASVVRAELSNSQPVVDTGCQLGWGPESEPPLAPCLLGGPAVGDLWHGLLKKCRLAQQINATVALFQNRIFL